MLAPLLLAGAVNVTVADAFAATALTPVGAPGTVPGVTGALGVTEAEPGPQML